MALWKSQREDHTSDWLRTIPISSLFKGFTRDIYGDHDVSCIGILVGKEVDIGLDEICDKPLRPADMLHYSWDKALDMCVELTRSSPLTQTGMPYFMHDRAVIDDAGITVRKESPMGFLSEHGKDLRLANLLLYNCLRGKDAYLEKKKIKYGSICMDNGYKLIPFAFSTFENLIRRL
uniref:Uncharacterized protein n=1 Tax=Tanacetum cinerariifolium TaxID=118510 RepID=A0A6L2N8P8_TANCI|nr:hypothetical protein [Tanacetum cinerariifolium]